MGRNRRVIDVLEPPGFRAGRDPSRQLKLQTSKNLQESIDYVSPNAPDPAIVLICFFLEDNEAMIKTIMKGTSPHIDVMCNEIASGILGFGFLEGTNLNSNTSVNICSHQPTNRRHDNE